MLTELDRNGTEPGQNVTLGFTLIQNWDRTGTECHRMPQNATDFILSQFCPSSVAHCDWGVKRKLDEGGAQWSIEDKTLP